MQNYRKKCMSLYHSHPQFHSKEIIAIKILICILLGFFFAYVSIYAFEGLLIFVHKWDHTVYILQFTSMLYFFNVF